MRTKILLDLDKKVFVIAMRPHWWSKWIIDYSFSTNALYEALERKTTFAQSQWDNSHIQRYKQGEITMKAKYKHWYKCQKGQMPEDFENCLSNMLPSNTVEVLVVYKDDIYPETLHKAHRIKAVTSFSDKLIWIWEGYGDHEILAWMLPEPYKE